MGRKGRKTTKGIRGGSQKTRRRRKEKGRHRCHVLFWWQHEQRPKSKQQETDRSRKETKGSRRKEEATQCRPSHHRKTPRKSRRHAQMVGTIGGREIRLRVCSRSTKV